jgi:hypothetical protein
VNVDTSGVPLLVVVGGPCSGKTEFTKAVRDCGFLPVDWGEVLARLLGGDPRPRSEMLQAIVSYIAQEGRLRVVDRLVSEITRMHEGEPSCVAVSLAGARDAVELAYLLGKFPYHRVVFVHADLQERSGATVRAIRARCATLSKQKCVSMAADLPNW